MTFEVMSPLLPTELWSSILRDPMLNKIDHLSLLLVNTHFYDITLPILYSHLVLSLEHVKTPSPSTPTSDTSSNSNAGSAFHLARRPLQRLFDQLETSKQLRSYIRSFSLYKYIGFSYRRVQLQPLHFQELIGSILLLLSKCPNLQSLHLNRVHTNVEYFKPLITRPWLALEMRLESCILSGDPIGTLEDGETFNVRSLECSATNVSTLSSVVFAGSLTRLTITTQTTNKFTDTLSTTAPHQPLTSLRYLHLKTLTDNIIPFLALTPNIEELQIQDITRHFTYTGPWSTLLPSLTSFTGPSQLIPHLVYGRPITELSSWHSGWNNHVDFSSLRACFGSVEKVKVVRWRLSFSLIHFLEYLGEKNDGVEELYLEDTVHYLSREKVRPYLAQLKRLKNFRIFSCPGLLNERGGPTRDDLSWEKMQCERLQKEGCEKLEHVRITEFTTWRRTRAMGDWVGRSEG